MNFSGGTKNKSRRSLPVLLFAYFARREICLARSAGQERNRAVRTVGRARRGRDHEGSPQSHEGHKGRVGIATFALVPS